ncbi:Methyltransferase small domain-containing protein [Streptomyces sp. 2224.1]|uniref:methyltransferase n=1 Tax=Streptomyces sp. 2224.1 TaxID=1881020 RepID=UPI00089C4153|nr:class I SAM-dependent methyltransferase [Streptomyces sp. 2224.1]SEC57062.1 Methyltransferase small domain-containing protein [Streptomyces sp. 2224.1]
MNQPPVVEWTEADAPRSARWRSENGTPPPRRVVIADDRTKADDAYRAACEGTALLWRGDFHNARQLLTALARRIDRRPRKAPPADVTQAFHVHRAAQNHRARILGMLLVPLDATLAVPLHRAPDVREACTRAYGPVEPATGETAGETEATATAAEGTAPTASLVSLRELLALIGANEWRRKGVEIPALGGDRIHPHYGVFSPARGEYVDLVAEAPLPGDELAFDIGTGTGVLASVLARRGVRRVVATDQDPRALACARENTERLGVAGQVEVVEADLFPAGRAPLIVCNPPWVPAKPTSPVEYAVYDPGNRMLYGFLSGLADHLTPDGEGWLILSDLAEHLGLRTHDELLEAFTKAGLTILGRHDITPRHPRARDTADPLHVARAAEVTSLWRLGTADRGTSGTP